MPVAISVPINITKLRAHPCKIYEYLDGRAAGDLICFDASLREILVTCRKYAGIEVDLFCLYRTVL
jgi:hypothetical protein